MWSAARRSNASVSRCYSRNLTRIKDSASRERIRQRIREIDAQKAGRAVALEDGGSLSSEHTTAQLARLCETAAVCELGEGEADEKRCFVLQHPDEPSARLAQIWLLPPYPTGRYDAGVPIGVGPTLICAQTHRALPLAAAAPLVAHLLDSVGGSQPMEAAAALPGLSAWIRTLTVNDLCSKYDAAASDAAMVMALDGERICDFPEGIKLRALARPVWESLATEFALTAAAEEAALYRDAGAAHVGIAYVADISPVALEQSGGALSALAWH